MLKINFHIMTSNVYDVINHVKYDVIVHRQICRRRLNVEDQHGQLWKRSL